MSDPLYSRITQSELFTSVKTLCSIRSCSEILEQTFFKSCTWRSENFSNWLRTHWKTEDPASQLPEHPLMKEPDSGLYWDCSLCYRGSWSASRRCKWLRPGSAEWGRTGPYVWIHFVWILSTFTSIILTTETDKEKEKWQVKKVLHISIKYRRKKPWVSWHKPLKLYLLR